MSDDPQSINEDHLRGLFAAATSPAAGDSPELLDRIVTGATKRRRRSAAVTIVGTTGSTLALVAALVAAPGLLTTGLNLAAPAASSTGSITVPVTQSPTVDSASSATTAASGSTTIATSTATRLGTTPPSTVTVPPKGTSRNYADLLTLFPDPSTLGPGMSWYDQDPGMSAAGAAPVMGFHYCDAIDVPKQIGAATYAAAEKQVTAALGSALTGGAEPSVDIVLAVWAPGHGSAAMQQIRDNTGMCVWIGSPTSTAWAGHDGLLVTSTEVYFNKWHQASAIQLVGDITVGVSVVDGSSGVALQRAQVLCDRMAEAVRASGIGQG